MTTFNRTTLKTFFETGDVPNGNDYANLIDSCLNMVETGPQNIAGAFGTTELVASRVSAGPTNLTGTLTVAGITSAQDVWAETIHASAFNIPVANLTSLTVSGGILRSPLIVSAAGSTQATAAPLGTVGVIRAKGIVDGSTTGFLLGANQGGNQQTIWIEENTSCNLYPCTGGQINALASNAAFSMAGKTTYIITHIAASAYTVK